MNDKFITKAVERYAEKLEKENKCCATCERATQLSVGDTPTVYRFCQLSGSIPHLFYEYCEDYIPNEID